MGGRPLDVLEASLDEDVTVYLKDGRAFHGLLGGYDQHMNVVLEPGDEIVEGALDDPNVEQVDNTTIIRGDNVVTIST
ncbi:Like-Sm ribonucleoprotein core [Haloplanus rallus]|uniref:Like-Sm ribonucleoprotein core n=1 Tax=Haloplanus rallus TaxID=1816183 RepID=A0A6B9FCU9_9EURY|nr:LSM domain-containing protein [Haloplanus rallus]QGX96391.1 Like-Sm ribonucleoprotein core [Haloplanus rallus]